MFPTSGVFKHYLRLEIGAEQRSFRNFSNGILLGVKCPGRLLGPLPKSSHTIIFTSPPKKENRQSSLVRLSSFVFLIWEFSP